MAYSRGGRRTSSRGNARRSGGGRWAASGSRKRGRARGTASRGVHTVKVVVETQPASPVSRNFINPAQVAGALPRRAKY